MRCFSTHRVDGGQEDGAFVWDWDSAVVGFFDGVEVFVKWVLPHPLSLSPSLLLLLLLKLSPSPPFFTLDQRRRAKPQSHSIRTSSKLKKHPNRKHPARHTHSTRCNAKGGSSSKHPFLSSRPLSPPPTEPQLERARYASTLTGRDRLDSAPWRAIPRAYGAGAREERRVKPVVACSRPPLDSRARRELRLSPSRALAAALEPKERRSRHRGAIWSTHLVA